MIRSPLTFAAIPYFRLTRRWVIENTTTWLSVLIVVGVLGASAYLAQNPSMGPLLLLLAAAVGAAVFFTFMRWPALGVVSVVPGSMAMAFSVAAGSEFSTLNPAFLLTFFGLGLWVLDMFLKRRVTLATSRPLMPLFLLVGITLLAFGFGQLPWYTFPKAPMTAQVGGIMIAVVSAGAFLLAAHRIRDVRWLEWMTWIYVGLGGILVAELLFPPVTTYFTDLVFQPGMNGAIQQGVFQKGVSNGSLFWIWLVALAFSQAVFNRQLPLFWRLAMFGIIGLAMYYSLFPNRAWVSGYAPALVTMGVILWAGAPELGVLATFLGAMAGWLKMQSLVNDVVMVGDNSYSMSTRVEAWAIVWNIAKVNPVLGLGPSNYYFYSERFAIRGYNVKFNSHSNYVDLVAQTGLLGLACFLWFFGEIAWLGWRLRSMTPAGSFARAYVYGALGAAAGMIVAAGLGDWVLPFVYNVGFTGMRASVPGWLFLGGLVALEQIYRPDAAQTGVGD